MIYQSTEFRGETVVLHSIETFSRRVGWSLTQLAWEERALRVVKPPSHACNV